MCADEVFAAATAGCVASVVGSIDTAAEDALLLAAVAAAGCDAPEVDDDALLFAAAHGKFAAWFSLAPNGVTS